MGVGFILFVRAYDSTKTLLQGKFLLCRETVKEVCIGQKK